MIDESKEKQQEIDQATIVFERAIVKADSVYIKLLKRIDYKPQSLEEFDEDRFLYEAVTELIL